MCKNCKECGKPTSGKQAFFCSTPCRKMFNNRRMTRGAILYDLYMARRFERDAADAANLRSIMARLASEWRVNDGRETWGDWRAWMRDNPAFRVERLGRIKVGRM